jgi:hypothetical protein
MNAARVIGPLFAPIPLSPIRCSAASTIVTRQTIAI